MISLWSIWTAIHCTSKWQIALFTSSSYFPIARVIPVKMYPDSRIWRSPGPADFRPNKSHKELHHLYTIWGIRKNEKERGRNIRWWSFVCEQDESAWAWLWWDFPHSRASADPWLTWERSHKLIPFFPNQWCRSYWDIQHTQKNPRLMF